MNSAREKVLEQRLWWWKLIRNKVHWLNNPNFTKFFNAPTRVIQNPLEHFYFLQFKVAEEVLELLEASRTDNIDKIIEEVWDVEDALIDYWYKAIELKIDIEILKERVSKIMSRILKEKRINYYDVDPERLEKRNERWWFDRWVVMQDESFKLKTLKS